MPALVDIPPDLAEVQDALDAALARVEACFNDALRSDLPVVERLCRHVEQYRGKMLRPTLVILSALAASPPLAGDERREVASASHPRIGSNGHGAGPAADAAPPPAPSAPPSLRRSVAPTLRGAPAPPHHGLATSDTTITLAAVCEMIHMATLVHDDVLDEADTRRRGRTVNRLAGNEAAVILGDYLFSAAYRLCSSLDSQQAALLIGHTGMALCAGELLQLHHRDNLSIDEDTYFEIVTRKTASLIATACRLGALAAMDPAAEGAAPRLAEPRHPWADALHDFGLDLGIAFQIQDDLLDLTGAEALVGKPVRKDLEMGKLTLPIIHHLAAAPPLRRGRTLDLLLTSRPTAPAPGALLAALEETDSIEHARLTASRLVGRAKARLDPLPDTPPRRFLRLMADAVIARSF
jgi:octaprenyl-diphosphate synthase